VRLLHESFPDRSSEVVTWPACQRLLPHVLAAVEHAERLGVGREEAGWLLYRVSAYLRGRGQPRQARTMAERALAIIGAGIGPDHANVAALHSKLQGMLRELELRVDPGA
jgi:hypothetical protein